MYFACRAFFWFTRCKSVCCPVHVLRQPIVIGALGIREFVCLLYSSLLSHVSLTSLAASKEEGGSIASR